MLDAAMVLLTLTTIPVMTPISAHIVSPTEDTYIEVFEGCRLVYNPSDNNTDGYRLPKTKRLKVLEQKEVRSGEFAITYFRCRDGKHEGWASQYVTSGKLFHIDHTTGAERIEAIPYMDWPPKPVTPKGKAIQQAIDAKKSKPRQELTPQEKAKREQESQQLQSALDRAGIGKPTKAESLPTASPEVFITDTGAKYHRNGCRHLKKSEIPITEKDAIARGYKRCQICAN